MMESADRTVSVFDGWRGFEPKKQEPPDLGRVDEFRSEENSLFPS